MKTADQIVQDIDAYFKHLAWIESTEYAAAQDAREAQYRAIECKPKPFEFAKLEQWKPSKHAKR